MAKEKQDIIHEYHLNRHQPDKPQFALHDLNSYIKQHPGDTTRPHIHSFYQIIWFKRGTGRHFIDFNAYDVFDNALFFVAKNQVHYFDGNTGYEGVLLHFNEAFLTNNENETEFFLKYDLFNNPHQQPSVCTDSDTAAILDEYVLHIKRELENDEAFGKEQILKNYLENFLIRIRRRKNEFEKAADHLPGLYDEKRRQLMRFVNFINENYKKGLSITGYARLLHISSRSLSDLTHQLLGKTPSQMIQERIILEAQRMLLYSDLNINQVGYRLGFDDASYFVKFFKKHTGISPSEFRKSVS